MLNRPMRSAALSLALLASSTAGPRAFAQSAEPSRIEALEQRLRSLEDREAISDLIVSYGLSFDRRDWALQRSLFTNDVEMDFSASIGNGLQRMTADDWVKSVRPFFENLPATQHIAYPQRIQITGDQAYAVSLLHAQHYLPNTKGEPVEIMVGWYENWLVRTPQGWKIRKMVQHVDWNQGNWWIFDKAAGKSK